MGVGAAFGVVGGRALLWFMRPVPLPSEGLYPLRTAGVRADPVRRSPTLAHGSGFLAVFVAGILIGEERAPYKREIERFHSALASLGEIVAFVVLGLTVDLEELTHADVLVPGLVDRGAGRADPAGARGALPAAGGAGQPASAPSCCSPGSRVRCRSCWAASSSAAPCADAERLYGIVVVMVRAVGAAAGQPGADGGHGCCGCRCARRHPSTSRRRSPSQPRCRRQPSYLRPLIGVPRVRRSRRRWSGRPGPGRGRPSARGRSCCCPAGCPAPRRPAARSPRSAG